LHSAGISFRKLESDVTLSESAEEASYNTKEPRTYRIRKGETAMAPHGVYHNDSRYFSNPDQYDPLRFIVTDSGSGAKRVNESALAPFADGLYGSKGNSFNEKVILAVIAAIVSMWEIESANENDLAVPGHHLTWGAFRPAKDVKVKLKLRV
jgi:cytochrome P450